MQNGYIQKWMMFISSYFPLYIWLLLAAVPWTKLNVRSHQNNQLIWFVCVLIVFSLISLCQIFILLKGSGAVRKPLSKELLITPESDSLMNYIITYITPFLTLDVTKTITLVQNLFLFVVIGLIYVGSSATFLNPVLGLLGYKIFGVSGDSNAHHIISKLSFDEVERAIRNTEEVLQFRIGEGVYIIR